ncbi:hypothetical protein ACJX0J_016992, partial [Zea mays]
TPVCFVLSSALPHSCAASNCHTPLMLASAACLLCSAVLTAVKLVDGQFAHAILRYLASVFPGVADHWYPADLFTRAKIESILDWHHSNLRRGAAVKQAEKLVMQSLGVIESVWLKGDAKFLLGSPQPSIADLSLVCEIMQLE